MTGYQRLIITGPTEAFDKISEKVYVEERSRDELKVIIETGGSGMPDQVIRDAIKEEVGTLSDYSCSGEGIPYQEDLPEELRDEEEFEEEQDKLTPEEKSWSEEEVINTLTILQAAKVHEETNAGDRDTLEEAQERLKELYGDNLQHQYTEPDAISEDEVKDAFNLLQAEEVEHRGKKEYDHPNNILAFALDYVEQRFKYSDDLPENPNEDLAEV